MGVERRLEEDRAARDAARRLVEADLGFVKGDVADQTMAKRAVKGARETSLAIADEAARFTRANPVPVIGGLLVLILILLRNPILDFVLSLLGDDGEDAPQVEEPIEPEPEPEPEPRHAWERSWRKFRDMTGGSA